MNKRGMPPVFWILISLGLAIALGIIVLTAFGVPLHEILGMILGVVGIKKKCENPLYYKITAKEILGGKEVNALGKPEFEKLVNISQEFEKCYPALELMPGYKLKEQIERRKKLVSK